MFGVIVIPKLRHELSADWRVAEQHGVVLLCRPDIEKALERTRFPPNADLVLADWLQLGRRELMTQGLSAVDHP